MKNIRRRHAYPRKNTFFNQRSKIYRLRIFSYDLCKVCYAVRSFFKFFYYLIILAGHFLGRFLSQIHITVCFLSGICLQITHSAETLYFMDQFRMLAPGNTEGYDFLRTYLSLPVPVKIYPAVSAYTES